MESKGLKALKKIKKGGREDDDFGWLSNSYLYEEEIATIEKELKAKANLVSMCENLAKLVGLKEKDYVELETLITNKLKALNEIVALYDKWLGNEMSDYEFFTLLNDIKYKYGLENEVLL